MNVEILRTDVGADAKGVRYNRYVIFNIKNDVMKGVSICRLAQHFALVIRFIYRVTVYVCERGGME